MNDTLDEVKIVNTEVDSVKKEYEQYIIRLKQDLAQYERTAWDIWKLTELYALEEGPRGDLAEKVESHLLVILKGRERPEWTFDSLLRERDQLRLEVKELRRQLGEVLSSDECDYCKGTGQYKIDGEIQECFCIQE